MSLETDDLQGSVVESTRNKKFKFPSEFLPFRSRWSAGAVTRRPETSNTFRKEIHGTQSNYTKCHLDELVLFFFNNRSLSFRFLWEKVPLKCIYSFRLLLLLLFLLLLLISEQSKLNIRIFFWVELTSALSWRHTNSRWIWFGFYGTFTQIIAASIRDGVGRSKTLSRSIKRDFPRTRFVEAIDRRCECQFRIAPSLLPRFLHFEMTIMHSQLPNKLHPLSLQCRLLAF